MVEPERLITAQGTRADDVIDSAVRPRTLSDYIGQAAVKSQMEVFITAAGNLGVVKLTRSRIDSIIHECATLCADPRFFERHEVGINCASGFVRFDETGTPSLETHRPEHRCRHTLPGNWHPSAPANPPADTLLSKLLQGVFEGDGVRILQIVFNLASNAIKFTGAGEVAIRVEVEDRADAPSLVRIEVADSGIGFDKETADRLFNRFIQADGSISRQFGGTGLGLAICRELA